MTALTDFRARSDRGQRKTDAASVSHCRPKVKKRLENIHGAALTVTVPKRSLQQGQVIDQNNTLNKRHNRADYRFRM